MLQKLHESIKGWVATVVIGVVCLTFVLWGVEYYVNGSTAKGKVLAKVDGKDITENQVNTLYRRMQQQVVSQGTPLSEQVNNQLKMVAVNNLVAEIALSQAATKAGFIVDKSQVQQLIFSAPAFQSEGHFSPERFQQFLYNNNVSEAEFIEQLQTDMLINQVANGIQISTFVLPNELENYYDLLNQQRSFGYMVIPSKRFVNSIKVSEQDEKNYYENNREFFRVPEQVSIEYLALFPQQISGNIQVSEKEMQQYYQDNIGNYRVPETWKIQRITVPVASSDQAGIEAARAQMQLILDELKKGTSFATVMQREKGVEESVSATSVSPQLLTVLKTLKPQQTSAPFNTPQGFVLVHLISQTPASTQTYAAAEAKIKEALQNQKAQKIIAEMSDKLSNLTYTTPDSLQPAAKALNINIQTSPLFGREGTKTGVTSDPNVIAAVFSKDVLQNGNNSNPITLKDGSVVVLRIKQHISSSIPEFAQLQAKIHSALIEKMSQAKAALLANQIQTQILQGQSANQVAQKNGVTWIENKNIARNNKNISSNILAAVFSMKLNKNKNVSVIAMGADTAIVQLQAITKPDFSKITKSQKKDLQAQLLKMHAELNYQIYVNSVKNNTKIKITQEKPES